jgi:hypothetical protein
MHRSDRAVAVMARRTPWILRAIARFAPATDEQPESARLEPSESSTLLTGESHSDVTDVDASVLDPTFTSCLSNH